MAHTSDLGYASTQDERLIQYAGMLHHIPGEAVAEYLRLEPVCVMLFTA